MYFKIKFGLFLMLLFQRNDVLGQDLGNRTTWELLKLGEDVTNFLQNCTFQPGDVTFYLLSRTIAEPLLITPENIGLVDTTKKTKIVVHGWLENHKASWYKQIADQCLKNEDLNFIEVDYERPARLPYVSSAKDTRLVGYQLAQLIQNAKLSPKNVHLIGHSLGSHVVGFAGKKVLQDNSERVNRISALDPAGPYFSLPTITPNDRLDKTDADIVDVIHTDAGFYGYENTIGTLDIYVNGGSRIQPGCLEEFEETSTSLGYVVQNSFCSHTRSYKYFIEWIGEGKFDCQFCKPIFGMTFYGDRCAFHHTSQVIGAKDVEENLKGVCFTTTNDQKPFLS